MRLHLDDIHGLDDLRLNYFPVLDSLVVKGCKDLENLYVSCCDWLCTVDVSKCNALAHMQIGTRSTTSAAAAANGNGIPRLSSLSCDYCPLLSSFNVENLPSLEVLLLQNNVLLQDVRIDGDSCSSVVSIALAGNPKLTGERCILLGNFTLLEFLKMSNIGLTRMPVTSGVFPRLHTIDLRANHFRDPLDFTTFPAVHNIGLDGNVAPPRDRGGQPFRLCLMVTPPLVDGEPELRQLDGGNMRFVYENAVPIDRLAPVELAVNESNGDSLGEMSSEDGGF